MPEVLAPTNVVSSEEADPPIPAEKKKRGRKPGTKVVRLKTGQTVAIPPAPGLPAALSLPAPEKPEKLTKAKLLREAFRERMELEADWIWARVKHLSETATKEEHPQVVLMNKLLDKLLPDAREEASPTETAKPPTIIINNLNRGAAHGG